MGFRLTFWAFAIVAIAQLGLAKDPLANTKHYYKKAGPGDSRSPCPGLNALANHGYIPRNGKNVNIAQLVLGAFQGLGVSPETSGFVAAVGFGSSKHPVSLGFDLEDLSRHGLLIEHDCSFSREDVAVGNNNDFNRTLWNVALKEIKKKPTVSGFAMGRAKSARVKDEKTRHKTTVYGPRAAAFGAIEVGMVVSALGGLGPAKLEYIRSIFEQERIPSHLGWKRSPLSDNAALALGIGVQALAADPDLIRHAGRVALSTPADILSTLRGAAGNRKRSELLDDVTEIITGLGFSATRMEPLRHMLGEDD